MKVLFLIKSHRTASSRIRVVDLLPVLQQNGIEGTVMPLPRKAWQRLRALSRTGDYDAVVLQKGLLNRLWFALLRRHAGRLIFDFDDAIYYRSASPSPDPHAYVSKTRARRFRRTVNGVDLVIAANAVLAARVREMAPGRECAVMASSIRMDRICCRNTYEFGDKIVIGWIGARTTLRFLALIADGLRELSRRFPLVLRIVADASVSLDGVEVEFVPWTLETQYEEISRFDIGIMPLSPDPYSEGKAAYKLLQYLACGVPAVCSPVGMNVDVSAGDRFCLSAATPEAFTRQLERLMTDARLRRGLGVAGAELVREKYAHDVIGNQLAAAIRRTVTGDTTAS
ncbi:MAG: glycosyltransferase [Victivallales bacterium]|nr:glycosyltransferase [Victivallales bacterium]